MPISQIGTNSINQAADTVLCGTSGNVGIGVTPSAWGSGARALQIGAYTYVGQQTSGSGNFGWNVYQDSASAFRYLSSNPALLHQLGNDGVYRWFTAPSGTAGNAITFTQAMTLDSSGNLLVGGTSTNESFAGVPSIQGATNCIFTNRRNSTSSSSQFRFYNPNGMVGEISTSGSATTYATSSDYRLKENVQPMAGALAVIAQLKPVTYTWKADGSAGQGFIAHELQAVVPDCVTGEKDAVDADGNPVYQGIDTSFLVATLTAAIQELKADLDATKAELAALKGQP